MQCIARVLVSVIALAWPAAGAFAHAMLDHASPATPGTSGSYLDLASQSREFALNDWAESPVMRRGSPLDRNTELLLPAPFDLSTITDASLESQHMGERARILAYEQERGL